MKEQYDGVMKRIARCWCCRAAGAGVNGHRTTGEWTRLACTTCLEQDHGITVANDGSWQRQWQQHEQDNTNNHNSGSSSSNLPAQTAPQQQQNTFQQDWNTEHEGWHWPINTQQGTTAQWSWHGHYGQCDTHCTCCRARNTPHQGNDVCSICSARIRQQELQQIEAMFNDEPYNNNTVHHTDTENPAQYGYNDAVNVDQLHGRHPPLHVFENGEVAYFMPWTPDRHYGMCNYRCRCCMGTSWTHRAIMRNMPGSQSTNHKRQLRKHHHHINYHQSP